VGAVGEAFLLSAVALRASLMSSHPEQVTRILRSFDAEKARVALSALKRGALLHKAAEMAKDDCDRAMALAHKLSFQLRAAEERAGELEVEAAHFR
jgi:hypothetical protein